MKSKILLFAAFATLVCLTATAQEEEKDEKITKEGGFKKENLFTGGNLTLQFGNQTTTLGVSPYFGYSITRWLDVAASLNFNYTSQRDFQFLDDRLRQTMYGPGAFVRIFPLNFLFAQAHFEHNFIKLKYIPDNNNNTVPTEKYSLDASSFLVGGGYAGGRNRDSRSFYYISVFWDIAGNENSPYLDNQRRTVPIIRAGYNIALFQGHAARRFRD